jgi:hypothetical protein
MEGILYPKLVLSNLEESDSDDLNGDRRSIGSDVEILSVRTPSPEVRLQCEARKAAFARRRSRERRRLRQERRTWQTEKAQQLGVHPHGTDELRSPVTNISNPGLRMVRVCLISGGVLWKIALLWLLYTEP